MALEEIRLRFNERLRKFSETHPLVSPQLVSMWAGLPSRFPALCGIRRFDAEAVPGAWKGLQYVIQLPPAQSQKRIRVCLDNTGGYLAPLRPLNERSISFTGLQESEVYRVLLRVHLGSSERRKRKGRATVNIGRASVSI
ncbi:hypothetical protein E4U30_005364 [Claviceps sp. LM220 group G6]|nr:hypothetical protein E4U30_005364 [Claviceps sp. LM220 group G6]